MKRNRVTKSVDKIIAANPSLTHSMKSSNNGEAIHADVDLQHGPTRRTNRPKVGKIADVHQPFPVQSLPPVLREMVTAVSAAERLPTAGR